METIVLFKNKNGVIHYASGSKPITRDEIQSNITSAQAELLKWSDVLAQYDDITADSPLEVIDDDNDGHITFSKAIKNDKPIII